MKLVLAVSALFFLVHTQVQAKLSTNKAVSKKITVEQMGQMARANQAQSLEDIKLLSEKKPRLFPQPKILPYGEYQDQGYLIFNDRLDFNSRDAKTGFVENMPEGITPIIYTQNVSPEYVNGLKETFAPYLKNGQELKVMAIDKDGIGFWARDTIPVPVYTLGEEGEKEFSVVDARYYHDFEPDQEIASLFGAHLYSHNYFYEGGNFVANSLGDCFAVNTGAVQKIPDSIFKEKYGCKVLTRLPFVKGIGHADESIRFVSDNKVITDSEEYFTIAEDLGFEVVLFPRAEKFYETYMNSVILGDTVYVPSFENMYDLAAMTAYQSLGYKTVFLNSINLSNDGLGSLHCISMVYPKMPLEDMTLLY